MFTLIIELYKALSVEKLDASNVSIKLDKFYDSVGNASASDNNDASIYYKTALQATNQRANRIERGSIIRSIISDTQIGNVKVALQPCNEINVERTLRTKVPADLLNRYSKQKYTEPMAVWGVENNNSKKQWDKLSSGDKVLFYLNKKFHYVGTVTEKLVSGKLSEILWQLDGKTWEYIYILKDLREIESGELENPVRAFIVKNIEDSIKIINRFGL